MDDLVKRLWESDSASALTNEAARRIEAQAALIAEAKEREAQLLAALATYAKWMMECPPVSQEVHTLLAKTA